MTGRDIIKRPPTEIALSTGGFGRTGKPLRPPTRIGGLVLGMTVLGIGLFVALITWASVSRIQGAVLASAQLRVEGNRQRVQHDEGGVVQQIRVAEGEHVEAGQVLMVLDDTRARASIGILESQLVSELARDARLSAEFSGKDELVIDGELAALLRRDPAFADLVKVQAEFFRTNREMFSGQVKILLERNDQLQEQVQGHEERIAAYRNQLALLQDELAGVTELYEKGLLTKSRYLQIQRSISGLSGDIAFDESSRLDLLQQQAENKERVLQVRRDMMLQVSDQRQVVQERLFDIRQRMSAAVQTADRTEIRAPVAGSIVGMEVNTLGAVIGAGETLMEIVPDGQGLVAEARVQPDDIEQVRQGAPTRIRLSAFNYRTTPMIDGEVIRVSADSFTDPVTGQPYYETLVRLDPDVAEILPDVELQPGMRAQVMIATKEQTIANYLLSPLVGGVETALLETN